MIVINSSTRQFNIPGAEMTFGVEADAGSERKYFQCPRYVGNKLDIASSFVRINYRNANGEVDSYLVEDLTVDGDNVTFSWELYPKVTAYKGQIRFVMCVVGPDTKVAWHTTLGTGVVLEGLEPDYAVIQAGTADVVAQLIALVDKQTAAVEAEGANQIKAVQAAAKTAEAASVAEIEAKGVNTRESIPEDYTSLENTVDSLVRGRAGAIVCEAAGSAVVVNDASDNYIQGLRIFGRSTQDGTPTPDAPVEIKSVVEPVVTVAGKNLLSPNLESKTVYGVSFTVNDDGSITVNGTATQGAYFWCYGTGTQATKQKPLPRGKYTVSGMTTATNGFIIAAAVRASASADRVVLGYGDTEESASFTVTTDTALCDVLVSVSTGTTVDNVTIYPMLEVGDVATEYEAPIAPQTLSTTHTLPGIPVTSGGNYTDSEGQQWICDEVDLERGVYVQRIRNLMFTGEEVFDNTWYPTAIYHIHSPAPHVNLTHNSVRCSHFRNVSCGNTLGTSLAIGNLDKLGFASSGDLTEYFVEQYRQNNPVVVQYAVATPTETPLSETEIAAYRAMHSNYPNTTVLNDSGAHMNVKYAADTKLYIDNKIAALIGG